ncbi:hypothetical protein EMIT074MI3_30023 [Bacillus licheniformis]
MVYPACPSGLYRGHLAERLGFITYAKLEHYCASVPDNRHIYGGGVSI